MSSNKALILCFDGTGNKFSGTSGDSNIVKIYSLLDREDPQQCHYYQPGIGTYVETSSLSRKSRFGRIKSWYTKAKDQAVGTSFGEHVMSGYKFLMRYYAAGDDIYFFGRGAYTARFLAQMLDYIGLLSTGNEEMLRFAWKTFARWQMRTTENDAEKKKRRDDFEFMCKFRETFSRPIDPIRFIGERHSQFCEHFLNKTGLFDCVNSVPQFESAWMRRTKFPYTAKSTASVIRHAVSIDERRAKFRQDLISEARANAADEGTHSHHFHMHEHHTHDQNEKAEHPSDRPALQRASTSFNQLFRPKPRHKNHLETIPASSAVSQISVDSTVAVRQHEHQTREQHGEDEQKQDILEVWFAGQHGDIGGGWPTAKCTDRSASEMPLLWMLREAMRAGMPLDETKLAKLQPDSPTDNKKMSDLPTVLVDGAAVPTSLDWANGKMSQEEFDTLSTQTKLHDSLKYGGGLKWYAVLSWQIMENMPFRRMDLQPDGTWKPISWPLPRGETRDMPNEAVVHGSVIARMKADSSYRPGNLVLGGGGRGVRIAPESAGMGEWDIVREIGDLWGEAVLRKVSKETEKEHLHI